MIGFISLIASSIILFVLLNYLKPKNCGLNFIAIIGTTIISPILWHVIGYIVEGVDILTWIIISFPVSSAISFVIAVLLNIVVNFISHKTE